MKILTAGKYYGIRKSEIDISGVILSEYDYSSPRTDWHFHENPYFMYVLQGNLYDINKKTRTHCESGSLIFHNWQEAHYNTKETSYARGFHIEFPRKWFDQRKLDISLWEGSRLIGHPRLHYLLGKLYFEFKCQDSYSELSIELLLLQLCENIQTIEFLPDKEPAWVGSLRQILHEDSENVNLKSLSRQLGIHPVHISRAVPKYFASSLGDYLRQQKIKQALSYILNENYSLTEIANICGFSDQSHFTRTFKDYFNKTPSEFRKRVL
jgi:AraC family transcriptional regulator